MFQSVLMGALIMCVLFTVGCGPAEPPLSPDLPREYRVDCENSLPFRCLPDEEAPVISRVKAGSGVTLLSLSGRFARVRLEDGRKGWLLSGHLIPRNPDATLRGERIVKPTARYSYEQLSRDLAALESAWPESLRVTAIGESAQGRLLFCAMVGAEDAAHHILVQAALHGREHMGALLAMAQLEDLLITGVPNGVCFHIIPMANPDGVAISQGGLSGPEQESIRANDIAAGYGDDLTAREYYAQWKANAAGVDLNRNFPARWEDVHTRPGPSAEGWRGPDPASEPETRALMGYTRRYPFAATLSYHAMGSELYYEFGPASPANEKSRALGAVYARLTGYPAIPDEGGSYGGYKDWAISVMGIPSLTIELGSRECPLPRREFDMIWLRNREGLRAVAEFAINGNYISPAKYSEEAP